MAFGLHGRRRCGKPHGGALSDVYSVTEGDTKGRAARASMVRAGRAEHEGDTDLGAKPELKCRRQKMCQGGHATEPADLAQKHQRAKAGECRSTNALRQRP